MKDMYYFFDGEDMAEFIDWIGHPQLKACWDTGHANVEGHQYKDLVALGDRLTALHINDNLGEKDQHMHPFIGTLNTDEVMHGLLDAGFKGYFTFECQSVVKDNYWLHKRHRFDEDTRTLNPGFSIVKKMTEVTYAIGEHVLSQYGCFEE
jgi:sugar phosphate isomerase/epimerase